MHTKRNTVSLRPRRSGLIWTAIGITGFAAIIVPFILFGSHIDAWTIAFMEGPRQHPVTVAITLGGVLASDILLPVPSSIVSTGCGLFLGFLWGTMVSWIGMILSCAVGYILAAQLGRPFVARMVGPTSMTHFETLRARYGHWIIVLARPVPVIAEMSVLFAGLGRMPPWRFFLLSTLSNLGISVVYAAIGAFSVAQQAFLPAIAGSLLLPGIGMLWGRLHHRRT